MSQRPDNKSIAAASPPDPANARPPKPDYLISPFSLKCGLQTAQKYSVNDNPVADVTRYDDVPEDENYRAVSEPCFGR